MTFIQAVMRKKSNFESVHRPEIGRRSAPGLIGAKLMVEFLNYFW
jgi:hypothetical protein